MLVNDDDDEEEEKDLGVIVSDDFKWQKQCSHVVSKANKVLGRPMIKRNFVDRSKGAIIPLYKSLLRPRLEYCCQVWNSYFNKDKINRRSSASCYKTSA